MKINLRAPFNPLGYGQVGRNILIQLMDRGEEVAYFPIGQIQPCSSKDTLYLQEAIDNQDNFDPEAMSLNIWHQHSLAERVGNGLNCGFPIFELDRFSDREKAHLRSVQRLYVTSEWGKGVILNEVPEVQEVIVAPLGVDRSVFNEDIRQPSKTGPTVFLNIGKWEIRKGHDILVEAFNRAFDPSDNVMLQMMNHNPFLQPQQEKQWIDAYRNSPMGEHVLFIPRVQTNEEVAQIMSMADCGVFPSRAEGWNLEALEMMACGRWVITTDCSAHTQFCNNENSLLIDVNNYEEANDGVWFNGEGNWAFLGDYEVNKLAEIMKYVHDMKQNGNLEINTAGIETSKKFSWEHTIECILQSKGEKE